MEIDTPSHPKEPSKEPTVPRSDPPFSTASFAEQTKKPSIQFVAIAATDNVDTPTHGHPSHLLPDENEFEVSSWKPSNTCTCFSPCLACIHVHHPEATANAETKTKTKTNQEKEGSREPSPDNSCICVSPCISCFHRCHASVRWNDNVCTCPYMSIDMMSLYCLSLCINVDDD